MGRENQNFIEAVATGPELNEAKDGDSRCRIPLI